MNKYVHGYSEREKERLRDQSQILEELLHAGTVYRSGSKVLEAGCGVGAQTRILARRSPEAEITSIDVSQESLDKVAELIDKEHLHNVRLQPADIMKMPFDAESFDHVFVCFVLEHLSEPVKALGELKKVLRPGGTLTVIEGDHGSCFWHPETEKSLVVWQCLITAQEQLGHNSLIGRQLHPLLEKAGFAIDDVSPRWVYADGGNPVLLDGVVNKIIVPMVETARNQALELGLIDEQAWDNGIADLQASGIPPNGTFFYTWFKATATK